MSDEKKILTKSSSESKISDIENQLCDHLKHITFCTCQEAENFTCGIEDIYVDSDDQEENMSLTSSKSVETYRFENSFGFKTYEIPSLRVVIQGPEILNFQGKKHSLDEIAVYWKKDARTWLWKSSNSTYRRKNKFRNIHSSNSKI